MNFVDNIYLHEFFKDKTVAVVGSGPSVLKNARGFIDDHDIVVRVNNFKLNFDSTGSRTDVHYSYFGGAIRKTQQELIQSKVKLCICKCPDSKFIDSEWHEKRNKLNGIDFRYIYTNRKEWWFTETFVPTTEEFLESFILLEKHVPTSGFAAIYKLLSLPIKSLYITGFDFFESGVHNVNERWNKYNVDDPIRHRPELEKKWLKENYKHHPIILDYHLTKEFR